MAFGRKTITASAEVVPRRQQQSLIASAIRTNISDLSYNLWKFRDETWQRELWRFYDIIPEFGFAARWVGQCCSKVRIYVADVDKLGRVQGETKNAKINSLADTLLGGPAAKAEALRALGINLTVAGECYIVGRPGDFANEETNPKDEWYVLSSSEMRRVQSSNGEWQWAWYLPDGNPFTLDLDRNVITRVWTPHPARVWCAEAPAKSCQMVLRELEQLTKYVFSQIDSRLVSAGLMIIPNNLDLPQDPNTPMSPGDSLMMKIATAAAQSLRGEGSALGVLPMVVESDNPDGWKLLSFESALSSQAMELRKEAVNRLGVGLDMPPEVLTGLGESNHWCLSIDTEILTQDRGWVTYDQLSLGDQVMTLDHDTGIAEWQSTQAVNVFDVVDEPVLSLESRTHSSLSTANHRWPVTYTGRRLWLTSADEFNSAHGIPVAARSRTLPTEPKYTDDFVKLVAAYTSDGTLVLEGNTRKSHLTKFKLDEISEIRQVLSSTFPTSQWYETVEHTAVNYDNAIRFHLRNEATAALESVAPDKVKAIKIEFIDTLTEAQLYLLLESMINVGDGVRTRNGYTFFQVEKERLNALERAAILLGLSVTWSTRKQGAAAFGTRPLHVLTVNRRKDTYPAFAKPTWTTYTGKVWCPTTANGTWLARRNGKVFYTGNSGFLIDGYGIKVHIEPLMNRICDALTKAYLIPALKLMDLDPRRYTYAFDTSPLALRPQRLQDALNLYEKGIVGAEAVRSAGYFKESEAPDVEEDVERFLREMMLRDGALLQNEAVRLAAGIPEDIISQEDMIAAMPMDPALMGMDPMALGGAPPPGQEGGGPPPPPAPPTGIHSELPPPMPNTMQDIANPRPPTGIQAGAASQRQMEDLQIAVVAEATVRRGLELAGKRLLDKESRNRFPDVPTLELHTRIKVEDQARVNRLLTGAWDQLAPMTDYVVTGYDSEPLQHSLLKYCSFLLLSSSRHDPQKLLQQLRADGIISAA